jgi:hypothetical protein
MHRVEVRLLDLESSTSRIGVTSAAVPHMKTSSAR